MACISKTLSSIDARCEGSQGGIRRILIAPFEAVKKADIALNASGEITGVTLATSGPASAATFAEYNFRRNTGQYTSTMESDVTIGNHSVTTEITLQFSKAEALKRLAIIEAINSGSRVIIEDQYGQHLFVGYENPVEITNAVMQSGTANTDLSGFTLTFNDTAQEFPHFFIAGFDVDSLKTRQ